MGSDDRREATRAVDHARADMAYDVRLPGGVGVTQSGAEARGLAGEGHRRIGWGEEPADWWSATSGHQPPTVGST